MTNRSGTGVLVCAPVEGGDPRVVVADGSYETDAERVFWRSTVADEVLRLPLQAEVSVRPLRRFPEQRRPQDGELRLLAAVARHVGTVPRQRDGARERTTA